MAVTYVGKGAQSTGAGGNRGPSLPAGMVEDDFMLGAASARTNTGSYTHPTSGWSDEGPYRSGNKNTLQFFWKFHDGSESVSALQYTQGEDGSSESQAAQYAAFRGVDQSTPFVIGSTTTETSVQSFTWDEGVTVPAGGAAIYVGHKSDDWTGVADLVEASGLTWVEIGEPDTTTGNDAGMVWGYALNGTGSAVIVTSATAAVSGGAAANTLALFMVLNPSGGVLVSGSGSATLSIVGDGDGSVGVTGTGEPTLTITAAGEGSHQVTGTGSATLTITGSGAGTFIGGVVGSGAAVLTITGAGTGSAPVEEDPPPPLTVITAPSLSAGSASAAELGPSFSAIGDITFLVTSDGDFIVTSTEAAIIT